MAVILSLETATTNCSVGISKDGKSLALVENNAESYSHAEQLHIFIQQALEQTSHSFSDLDAVAVSMGPGSYTGLRIGVSAAKGLCYALDLPLISVSTLESMAHQIEVASGTHIIPVLDARRMEVYSSVFNHQYDSVREIRAEIIDENSFSDYISTTKKALLIGNGAEKCKEILQHPNLEFVTTAAPSSKEMAPLAYNKYTKQDFEDVAYFEPYYLKDFIVQKKKVKS